MTESSDGIAETTGGKPDDSAQGKRQLSLRARWSLVAIALLVGFAADRTKLGVQFAWALQFGLFLAVSIVASCWFVFAVAWVGGG